MSFAFQKRDDATKHAASGGFFIETIAYLHGMLLPELRRLHGTVQRSWTRLAG